MSALSSQSTSSASEVNAAGSDAELPETWSSDFCISSSDSYVSHEPEEPEEPEEPFLLSLGSEVDVPTGFSKLDNPALLPNQLSESVYEEGVLNPARRRCIIS